MPSDLLGADPLHGAAGARPPRTSEGETGEAAALTADLVKRGRNPWWGKDQATRETAPRDNAAHEAERPPVQTMGVRSAAAGLRRVRAGEASARPSLFARIDGTLWRDVLVFLAVFSLSCAAMLYLSFRVM